MFSQPEIKRLFEPYTFVQLYTDRVPNEFYAPEVRARFGKSLSRQIDDAEVANAGFLRKVFGSIQLPLYVILEPRLDSERIDVIGIYDEGLINNVNAFASFLRKPEGDSAVAGSANGSQAGSRLGRLVDFSRALADARARKKLVFANFTALTDNNSKLNETKVLALPEVRNALRAYEEVWLYIDFIPAQHYPDTVRAALSVERMREIGEADASLNGDLLCKRFGIVGTPFYAILEPLPDGNFKELVSYQGIIDDPPRFVRFLLDAPKAQEKVAAR